VEVLNAATSEQPSGHVPGGAQVFRATRAREYQMRRARARLPTEILRLLVR
jgi:hypothetical protein